MKKLYLITFLSLGLLSSPVTTAFASTFEDDVLKENKEEKKRKSFVNFQPVAHAFTVDPYYKFEGVIKEVSVNESSDYNKPFGIIVSFEDGRIFKNIVGTPYAGTSLDLRNQENKSETLVLLYDKYSVIAFDGQAKVFENLLKCHLGVND